MLFRCPNPENIRQIHNYAHLDLCPFFERDTSINTAAILKGFEKV